VENKIALITGAAGGIGMSITRILGQRGVTVAAVDWDKVQLDEVVKKSRAAGLDIWAFPANVANSTEVESVVDEIERQLGPLDFLVNAAGVLRLGEARAMTEEDWSHSFEVNATGVFLVSRAVVNRMVPRSRGAIVTVASNAAGTARMEMAAYAASKAAASMFTKCLGLEVAKHRIRCNVVAPGSTDTPMLSSMWHDESGPKGTIEGRSEAFRVGIPLGRIARPSDIADAVAFLLSEQAAHITMETLTVDGGATLGV
jgi:2,3-dihydro-2,3-dihydroxybenzoate dehydrogenase